MRHVASDWLRDGRPEPRPAAVGDHLAECARCREELAAIETSRSYFDEPPPLAADSAAAIRFRLEAAARQARPAVRASRSPWRWSIAAIVLSGALAAAAWLAWPHAARPRSGASDGEWGPGESPSVARGDTAPSEGAERASVRASSDAVYERVATDPDEVYRVHEGTVSFDVPRLGRDGRFRVLVGTERVEVHGTRFRVTAEGDRLEAVAVDEGVVSLHLDDGTERLLSAGSRFDRSETIVANRIAEPRVVPRPSERPAELRESGQETSPAHERPREPERGVVREPAERERSPHEPRARRAANGASPAVAPTPDEAFQQAWSRHRAGSHDAAAHAFDALLERADLGGRRADVLYWSARSHDASGRTAVARARLEELVRAHPSAWHAADARARLERMSTPAP